MTPEKESAEFLEKPTKCPFCHGESYYHYDEFTDEAGQIHKHYDCDCGKRWYAIYKPVEAGVD